MLLPLILRSLVGALLASPACAHWPVSPRVMITTQFAPERDAWLAQRPTLLARNITLPGLSPLFPAVHCEQDGEVCLWVTGEGQINAAASTTALVLSSKFDFQHTYFFITGIAGGDPRTATLGGAAFAKYAVQAAQQYALDAREIPSNWTFSFWNYGTPEPGIYPTSLYGTELFALNFNLVEKAHHISKSAAQSKLNDTAEAKALRAQFDYAPANAAPQIVLGDVTTSDLYFTGRLLTEQFANLTKVLTNNTGTMVTSAQEDNGTLESLMRGHLAGLVDYGRVIVMRTVSDFLIAPPGVSQYDGFVASMNVAGPSLANLYVAGVPVVDEIKRDWRFWKKGVAPQGGFYGDILGSLQE